MQSLIIYKSAHHNNTKKIAEQMADTLKADLKEAQKVNLEEMKKYDLIGFGSGIYFAKHHKTLLNLVNKLKDLENKKVFIFSTAGMPRKKNHKKLRKILEEKRAEILDEFSCKGLDKFSILKLIGGINKDRPNQKDLEKAKKFAQKIISLSRNT